MAPGDCGDAPPLSWEQEETEVVRRIPREAKADFPRHRSEGLSPEESPGGSEAIQGGGGPCSALRTRV